MESKIANYYILTLRMNLAFKKQPPKRGTTKVLGQKACGDLDERMKAGFADALKTDRA